MGMKKALGRRPQVSRSGERLGKYAVKLFPEQWEWLLRQGNASEWLRRQIEKAMKREKV